MVLWESRMLVRLARLGRVQVVVEGEQAQGEDEEEAKEEGVLEGMLEEA